jgi:hypothetical protein
MPSQVKSPLGAALISKTRDSEFTPIIIDFFPCTAGVNRFNTRKSDDIRTN